MLDPTSSAHTQIGNAISQDDNSDMIDDIREQLLARGGMDHLLLLAGADILQSRLLNGSVTNFAYPATL